MIDNADIASAIPPSISQAPKEKPTKVKEPPQPKPADSEEPKKAPKKDDADITKIREKHALEQAAQRYARGVTERFAPS